MYVYILDSDGKKVYHKNIPCKPDRFLQAIEPFRGNLVVGVECIFCWYWLADLCDQESIDFVLGHALYMKAIHGVKTKNDRIDSLKIARLVKGQKSSAGKVYGTTGKRIGNAHLRWAFSKTAVLFLRKNKDVERYYNRLIKRHGKSKALSIVAKRLGIAVYYMLKRQKPFNLNMFLSGANAKQKA